MLEWCCALHCGTNLKCREYSRGGDKGARRKGSCRKLPKCCTRYQRSNDRSIRRARATGRYRSVGAAASDGTVIRRGVQPCSTYLLHTPPALHARLRCVYTGHTPLRKPEAPIRPDQPGSARFCCAR
ncbi:hypothetical protein MATL_G00123980 [Megalops atlanticus]|uniref:Uncharacterized protein n=1 Tax=Megalops atlanticus TaxID=7932 RepID=A0A9D3T574_MEGAT|nr:hypothetical protein MATL_G00123980 [Megalops atlanticus]